MTLRDDSLWTSIAEEHARTVAAVLEIVEADELLDRHPVVQRSVRLRNPYVDPLSLIQVDLLRRKRAGAADSSLDYAIGATMNGIAAGLHNPG